MTEYKIKNSRPATDEDIANMSNNFTLPARLAKKAADWQKKQEQGPSEEPPQENLPLNREIENND